MEIKVVTETIQEYPTDAIVTFLFDDDSRIEHSSVINNLNNTLHGALAEMSDLGDFSGESGQITTVYTRQTILAARVIMVGMGNPDQFSIEAIRRSTSQGMQKARDLKVRQVAVVLPQQDDNENRISPSEIAQAVTEGALLGLYHYHGQKTDTAPDDVPQIMDIVIEDATQHTAVVDGVAAGQAFAAGTLLTRELVNLPPNICDALYLAERAVNLGNETGLRVEVLGEQQIGALKMGAILAVNRGSEIPPRFVIIEHNHDRAQELATIVLVGKGVTFDTGGYSLKTRDGMVGMKADMGGAAAVMGAMNTVARLDAPLHVVGLLPISDNMISGRGYCPQDVITASNGKTIEVISTDAEGRLLLADALVYAKRYDPAAVVDIATLTGSCITALGTAAAGLFSNNDSLRDQLYAAGVITHERVWPLPLYPEYAKALESETADITNSGGARGGVGTSAMFLTNFVDYPAWAHIDIAGVAGIAGVGGSNDNPYIPAKSATGFGARLLANFVINWEEQ